MVMLSLLLLVSVAALAFVGVLFFSGALSGVLPPRMIEVLAVGEANVPAMAAANDPETSNEEPGWIGALPEDAPQIGTAVPENPPPSPTIPPNQERFANFPFYIPENAEAYTNFQAENPGMDAETVVWKVNAFLHLPFYSYIRVNTDPNPLLVNPSHRLPPGFVPAYLIPVYEGNPDLLATPETVTAFRELRTAAIRAGLDLAVVSAYRSAERQEFLFERQGRVDGVVARPYQSEHQTGRALDLWGPSGLLDGGGGPPSPTGIWVSENAHYHGFIVRYTAENTHITGFIHEPWHITYVGVGISMYIHENRLSSLEEFVARHPGWGL